MFEKLVNLLRFMENKYMKILTSNAKFIKVYKLDKIIKFNKNFKIKILNKQFEKEIKFEKKIDFEISLIQILIIIVWIIFYILGWLTIRRITVFVVIILYIWCYKKIFNNMIKIISFFILNKKEKEKGILDDYEVERINNEIEKLETGLERFEFLGNYESEIKDFKIFIERRNKKIPIIKKVVKVLMIIQRWKNPLIVILQYFDKLSLKFFMFFSKYRFDGNLYITIFNKRYYYYPKILVDNYILELTIEYLVFFGLFKIFIHKFLFILYKCRTYTLKNLIFQRMYGMFISILIFSDIIQYFINYFNTNGWIYLLVLFYICSILRIIYVIFYMNILQDLFSNNILINEEFKKRVEFKRNVIISLWSINRIIKDRNNLTMLGNLIYNLNKIVITSNLKADWYDKTFVWIFRSFEYAYTQYFFYYEYAGDRYNNKDYFDYYIGDFRKQFIEVDFMSLWESFKLLNFYNPSYCYLNLRNNASYYFFSHYLLKPFFFGKYSFDMYPWENLTNFRFYKFLYEEGNQYNINIKKNEKIEKILNFMIKFDEIRLKLWVNMLYDYETIFRPFDSCVAQYMNVTKNDKMKIWNEDIDKEEALIISNNEGEKKSYNELNIVCLNILKSILNDDVYNNYFKYGYGIFNKIYYYRENISFYNIDQNKEFFERISEYFGNIVDDLSLIKYEKKNEDRYNESNPNYYYITKKLEKYNKLHVILFKYFAVNNFRGEVAMNTEYIFERRIFDFYEKYILQLQNDWALNLNLELVLEGDENGSNIRIKEKIPIEWYVEEYITLEKKEAIENFKEKNKIINEKIKERNLKLLEELDQCYKEYFEDLDIDELLKEFVIKKPKRISNPLYGDLGNEKIIEGGEGIIII